MKKLLFLFVAFSLSATAQKSAKNYVQLSAADSPADIIRKAANIVPSARQLRWQQLELTAFFHFGINTFTNKEWGDGKEDIQLFNPTNFDAGQWVKTMKDAGFKQVIITAKHHDGFCLWPSKYTEHSVKNTPWKSGKGDVVSEVAAACKKYDIGFGIYLSPWDRNAVFYGDTKKYNQYFLNQLTELLTSYGKVDEVWFDGANGEGPDGKKPVYDFKAWYTLIRKLQPSAAIAVMGPDVRWVGTESGEGRLTEWSVLPADAQMQEAIAAGSQKDITFAPQGNMMESDLGSREKVLAAKGLVWYPAETDVSIRPGWFYHPAENDKVKSAQTLMDIYFTSVGRNSLLLLNVPPSTSGLINENDVRSLREFKHLLDKTFKNNLAKNAVIKVANGVRAAAMPDDNYNSFFTTTGKDSTATIEFVLPAAKTFDILMLQENIQVGQRIENFIVEVYQDSKWVKIAAGTTVGYKRLLQFPAVTANRVRVVISGSRLNPTISSFGLYQLAK